MTGQQGGAPDHAVRAQEFCARHRGVTIRLTPAGWEASWIAARGGGVMRETREILGHLMDCLESRPWPGAVPPGMLRDEP